MDALPAEGAQAQPSPYSINFVSTELNVSGCLAQPSKRWLVTNASTSDGLPADLRNRLKMHANNSQKTIVEQKLNIATLSAELHQNKEAHTQMGAEHKAQMERFQAWLMSALEFKKDPSA
ncbi:hypothetical protein PILCRDRAFT_93691 [Piloderma croceum F 1598]|uniref:Uncharacterized protein n=1 Tax=Piloderma croceum (strain F 1598) TaxID=765440 RepID=A0A0C3B3H3_PILCF|nr:hypothetical protein PILCRDRAFT_93691 [Piloderma croceum F 1598]